jgi:hypothetical protein
MAPVLAALLALASSAAAARPIAGFNFPLWDRDAYAAPEASQALGRLADTGAGWVAVIPTLHMDERRGSRVFATGGTASDASLRAAIRAARARGLKVLLKPHVDLPDPAGTPRALISPADPDAWFDSYGGELLRYARLAQDEGCEMFAVGTELALLHMPRHTGRWRRLIARVRGEYHGPLTFAANWHSAAAVLFWDELDYIGVDAYYPVPGGHDVAALREGWRPYVAGLAALSYAWGKPVLLTEIGLSSQEGANLRPWEWRPMSAVDLETQSAYLEALLRAFEGERWYAGFLYWAWEPAPDAGGPHDRGMSVQGKPAIEVLKRRFAAANAPVPPPGHPDLLEAERRVWQGLLRGVPRY